MSEWKETTLGDIAELKRGYDLPARERQEGPYPIISSSGVSGFHNKAMAKAPGVVTGRYGTLGQVFFVTQDYWPLNTSLYVRDFKGNDPRFLSYFLKTLDFLAYSDKAAVPGLNRNHLHSAKVRIPPLREQQAIACILGALDDKIELNRKRCKTLEAIARAIFQSWFVDFDPVHYNARQRQRATRGLASAAQHDPTTRQHPPSRRRQSSGESMQDPSTRVDGSKACARDDGAKEFRLSPELAALFPDRFEDSPLGPIPAGWKVGKVRELCVKVENGGTPKRQVEEFWTPAEVPWLTSGEVRQPFVVETETFISKKGFESSSAKMWPPFTTVVALYGATAGIATILGTELCANQACCGLVPKTYAACFIHQLLVGSLVSLQQQARGSAQQNLSQSIVADFPCLIPASELLDAFESQVHSLYQRCIEAIQESRTLAALRDTLLPKLISGELRVPDAERIVGRAT